MERFYHFLFPRSKILNFIIIICISAVMSFLLTGMQVFRANWGIIDDNEIFNFLGPDRHLPLADIWTTLMTKTEVGSLEGRFRPAYYLIKLTETSIFGTNVHLWYLGNTVGFAIFLGSLWWTLLRFVGGWLGGALTASVALLSLWAGIWSRLGPSEISGAAWIGIAVFAADFILFSKSGWARNLGAIVLALATIVVIGLKETFIPLALASLAVLWWAVAREKLSGILAAFLSFIIVACIAGIALAIKKEVGAGTDFNGKSIGALLTVAFGVLGILDGLARTWWLWVLPVIFFQMLGVIKRKPFREWLAGSRQAIGIYGFLILMYAAQCALYRSSFPHNSRYDFPAMLLVPLTCCILASEISRQARQFFPERTVEYAQLTAAAFLASALLVGNLGKAPPLVTAVKKNIAATNLFFNELQRLLHEAKASPDKPIILEAFGPYSYEPVLAFSYYLTAYGNRNPVSVRFHPYANFTGNLIDSLQKQLLDLQEARTGSFTPLADSLANRNRGCLSVGIFGPPDAACSGFETPAWTEPG